MKNLGLIFIFLLSLVLTSCVETVNKSADTTTDAQTTNNDTNTGGDTGGNDTGGGDDGNGNDDSAISYHVLNGPPPTMHGPQWYVNRGRLGPNNETIMWSSDTDLQGVNESIFLTDNRFNMRLVARNTGATVDSMGNSCHYQWQPFQKLKVEVRIRKKTAEYGYNHTFELDLDVPSKVKEFTVPLNSNDPLVVEILNVKWDYSCSYYANQGYPNYPGVCPWDNVWVNDCVAVEMQVATDYTTDLPGDRY